MFRRKMWDTAFHDYISASLAWRKHAVVLLKRLHRVAWLFCVIYRWVYGLTQSRIYFARNGAISPRRARPSATAVPLVITNFNRHLIKRNTKWMMTIRRRCSSCDSRRHDRRLFVDLNQWLSACDPMYPAHRWSTNGRMRLHRPPGGSMRHEHWIFILRTEAIIVVESAVGTCKHYSRLHDQVSRIIPSTAGAVFQV